MPRPIIRLLRKGALLSDAASAIYDSDHMYDCQLDGIHSQRSLCCLFFRRSNLLAIKLIESPLINNLCQFQEVASGAPLAMVAVAIECISPDLGSLCHY